MYRPLQPYLFLVTGRPAHRLLQIPSPLSPNYSRLLRLLPQSRTQQMDSLLLPLPMPHLPPLTTTQSKRLVYLPRPTTLQLLLRHPTQALAQALRTTMTRRLRRRL